MNKKAFTLAEIMVVLTVIGIITGILMPVAINSSPDEKVMKFKKANATLVNVITKLVRSDQYYKDGDLGIRTDGSFIDGTHTGDVTYFCNSFAEAINTKKVNCSNAVFELKDNYIDIRKEYGVEMWGTTLAEAKVQLDTLCISSAPVVDAEITASDNTIFYQGAPI